MNQDIIKGFYINGTWQKPEHRQYHVVVNPHDGSELAKVANATSTDIGEAVRAAKNAFPTWSATPASVRKQLMLDAANLMQQREQELLSAISQSMGCPKSIGLELQVQGSIAAFRQFAELTDYVDQQEQHASYTVLKEAIGVCVLINPWNYPLSQLVGKLGPALAVGATVIAKPAEQTPLQDLLLAEIFDQVGLPAGVFNVITGIGKDIGPELCSHPDVDMVSFTGSTAAGIQVAQAAAPSVKRVCQELGGKSPYIITADADVEAAVRYGVEDVMLNSGQTCSSLTRMLVHESCLNQAETVAKQVAEENVLGSPDDETTTMGPLSSFVQQKRVRHYIQQGIDEGAKLITGGIGLPSSLEQGAYVMPTIFSDVNNDMTIAKEEIFGPVLCILSYSTIEEAIAIANDTPYGLASAVYASSSTEAMNIAKRIRAGQCYIQGNYFNTDAPFGGYKQSGNGREWGEIGLHEFVEVKAVITA